MNLSDLFFEYPTELIATEPSTQARVLWNQAGHNSEITKKDLLEEILPGDVFVINDTRVEKRRVFGACNSQTLEILFVQQETDFDWWVLFPSSRIPKDGVVELPGGIQFTLVELGIPQKIRLNQPLPKSYFEDYGEIPLPPYIQKTRNERHDRKEDAHWYQTAWAQKNGSQAAPTASLHFTQEDLDFLKSQGVFVESLTLHVGLGTFLPVKTQDLGEHKMHSEWCEISKESFQKILEQKRKGKKIWALGTTATRTLESCALGMLEEREESYQGWTQLFIRDEAFSFQIVDCLLTNFHQPETTLLALVASFAGLENVKKSYAYAIEKKFRLFSYGDLSVWEK